MINYEIFIKNHDIIKLALNAGRSISTISFNESGGKDNHYGTHLEHFRKYFTVIGRDRGNGLPFSDIEFQGWIKAIEVDYSDMLPIIRRSSLKGTVTQRSYHNNGPKTLYRYFDPNNHDIYMRLYEDDKYGDGKKDNIVDPGNNTIAFTATEFDGLWFERTKGYATFHTGGFAPGGVMFVPAGSTWTPEVINGVTHNVIEVTSPGLNEITVKLA